MQSIDQENVNEINLLLIVVEYICFGSEWDMISLYLHKSFLCDKIHINSKPVDF